MDFFSIRRLVVISMFADDALMNRLVLKGGNALHLVHRIGDRASLDVDLSLEDDFDDLESVQGRLERALSDRFDSAGYAVFDCRLKSKPANPAGRPPTWGGYSLEFKLIERAKAAQITELSALQRNALVTAPGQQRTFKVEISKHEYCEEKVEADLDGYTIYVYPPAMIAVEKLRAICQQMPEYQLVRNKRARARDFYDIYSIAAERGVDLADHLELIQNVFAAKDVPLSLIARIGKYREYHREDWPSVEASVSGDLETYDYYFDWLLEETRKLEALWEE